MRESKNLKSHHWDVDNPTYSNSAQVRTSGVTEKQETGDSALVCPFIGKTSSIGQ